MATPSTTQGSADSDHASKPTNDPSAPWSVLAAAAFIALCTFFVFWNGLKGHFIADDHLLTRRVPTFEVLWLPETITSGIAARPILSTSFALNQILLGHAAWHFRIVNIAIHAASGLLLFGIIRRTVLAWGMLRYKNGSSGAVSHDQDGIRFPQFATGIAIAATLLWLVHPLQTASVTYIMQRAESLAGFFLFLTLYAAIRRFAGGNLGWATLAIAACILGMGVKQTMFAAPLLVLLYDYTFVSGSILAALRARPGLYAGLACSWALLAAMIVAWQIRDPFPEFGARDPWPYALTQPGVILYYLRLAIWPDPILLVYAWPYAETTWQIVPPLMAVGILATVTLWGLFRRSWIGFLGAWFFLILAPSSSFAALEQVVQCHRMYLPLAAVSVLAVVAGYSVLAWIGSVTNGGSRLVVIFGTVLLALMANALAWGTMRRNLTYWNELGFWQDNVARQPESRAALSALGSELMIRNRPADAEASFRKALTVNDSPNPAEVHYNLGIIMLGSSRYDEALSHFQQAHVLRPYHAASVERIGATLAAQGRVSEAIEKFKETLAMHPVPAVAAAAHNNLGTILLRRGELEKAADHFRQAVTFQPNSPEAQGNLGSALARLGRFDEARAPCETALRLKPDSADIHNNLGFVLLNLHRLDEATAHFREALRISPGHTLARKNLQTALDARATNKLP